MSVNVRDLDAEFQNRPAQSAQFNLKVTPA
jgi:hypothetical protein